VLIGATGQMHLDTEALDFTVRGRPKRPRLVRVRSPLMIRGTLSHPSVSVEKGKALAQAGVAIALGVALTPLASILAFVDPGLAHDADCAALLADPSVRDSSRLH
jgi:uncharacterized protein involved in outer membrane biogenesis